MTDTGRRADRTGAFALGAIVGAPVAMVVVFLVGTVALGHPMGGGFFVALFGREILLLGALLGGTYAVLLPSGRIVAVVAALGFLLAIAVGYALGIARLTADLPYLVHLLTLAAVAMSGAVAGALVGRWLQRDAESSPSGLSNRS